MMDKPLRVFGTGKQFRDIIYATDVARTLHAFYERGESGIYNIGDGEEYAISLLECIDVLAKMTGKRPNVMFENGRHGDLLYFICNIAKARKQLSWSPSVPPWQGIQHLLEWLAKNKKLY